MHTLNTKPAKQALAIAHKIPLAKDYKAKCRAVHKWHECVIAMLEQGRNKV
jgi:hypothetical protein